MDRIRKRTLVFLLCTLFALALLKNATFRPTGHHQIYKNRLIFETFVLNTAENQGPKKRRVLFNDVSRPLGSSKTTIFFPTEEGLMLEAFIWTDINSIQPC
jgi:hypothetical protein